MIAKFERIVFLSRPDGQIAVNVLAPGHRSSGRLSRKAGLIALAELAAALHLKESEVERVCAVASALRWHGVSHGGADIEPPKEGGKA